MTTDGDVWIRVNQVPVNFDYRFFGMATVSYPHGVNGPAEASVQFNLTAYVKHMIEQSKSA